MKELGIGLLLVGLAGASAGCGSSDTGSGGSATTGSQQTTTGTTGSSGGGGGAGGADASAKACKDVAQARCDRLKACSDDYLVVERYESDATCASRLEASCEAGLGAPSTAQTTANVTACASELTNESCDDLLDQNPSGACLPPHGKLANDKPCAFDAQCSTGWCQTDSAAACGKCSAMPAVGATCAAASDCGYDQGCAAKTQKCAKLVAAGGACGDSAPCGAGLSCVGAKMGSGGKCDAAITSAGAACDPTHKTMADCDRDMGLSCDPMTKKCKATTLAAVGKACGVVGDEFVGCVSGSACILKAGGTEGTCMKFAADDASCDASTGPVCLAPAKCVVSGSKSAGTCKLPDASACK